MSEEPASPDQDTTAVLRARAIALAQPPAEERKGDGTLEVIEFSLAHERYAVQTSLVREVLNLRELTPVPYTPAWMAGVLNLRGKIIAVLDLRKFFDLPEQGIADTHKVIVLSDEDMEMGLLADDVAGVSEVQAHELNNSMPTLSGVRTEYLKGVRSDGLVVLAAGKILSSERLMVNEQA